MSRLHEMKSKGLDKVYVMYSRSTFFGQGKTMQEVVDDIKDRAIVSGREHTSKTKVKTFKVNIGV
jgi:cyclophilin family peptidyl-prolyl cis-trans isomerase